MTVLTPTSLQFGTHEAAGFSDTMSTIKPKDSKSSGFGRLVPSGNQSGRRKISSAKLVLTESSRLSVPSTLSVQKTIPTRAEQLLVCIIPFGTVDIRSLIVIFDQAVASTVTTVLVLQEFGFPQDLAVTDTPESLLFNINLFSVLRISRSPDMVLMECSHLHGCPIPIK